MELISKIDGGVFRFMEQISCVALDWIMRLITYTGNAGMVWIILGLVLCFRKKTRKMGLCVILALAATSIVNNNILKEIFDRTRPFIADLNIELIIKAPSSSSFPSGHTSSSFTAATAIFLFDKKKGIFAYIYAFLMGFSRIYLHVHYFTDVLGGIVVGIVMAKLVVVGYEKLERKVYDKLGL